ncbi:spore-associated protein [Nocardiopsis sp. N85]|uniref:spore-associated protein n=1 Tax=Nocardiopsis sp. N85 TaxID=3029400 RepID=UPI00237FA18C|nr:spore-associated protein [Nocardiopsis sp. N85]MDE3723147.1 spore-associated protein [Nocardiopsis sp. N85]
MMRRKVRASWAGVLAVAVAVALLSPTSAVQAADPVAICNLQSAAGAQTYTRNADGWPRSIPGGGQMYLFYEGNLGQNCAVTIGSGAVDVGLRRSDGAGGARWSTGNGATGPVYVQAPGACVDVTGSANGRSTLVTGVNCGG